MSAVVILLHAVDYVVLSAVLIASLGIGFYFACFGGKQKTTKEYFRGDSNMNMFPVVLSLMASFLSSNGMLGTPAEVYHYGYHYIFTNLGAIIGIPLAVYAFMPVFYDLQITSVFEYLQRRFDKIVRRCGSLINIITMMIYASFVTYGPALALSQVTGFSLWGSILTTTVIGTIYTSIGGLKAVMWTDSMQLIIFTVALLITIVKGTVDVGGLSEIFNRSYDGGRIQSLSFSFDPRVRYTFWGIFISSTLGWMQSYGISQIQLQRYLSCPTKKAAQRSIWYNLPGMLIVGLIYGFIGLMLYSMYWNCDPLTSQQIQEPDQIFPLFVMKTMGPLPGLPGLFIAGVYSAALSTISSVLNSLAAITLEDHVKPYWKGLSDERATQLSKFIAVGYGALCLLLIAAIMNLGSIVQALWYLVGGTNGANFGLFTLGLMVPWANPRGTILGVVCGLSIAWWIAIGNQIYRPPSVLLPLSTESCDDILGEWTRRPKVIRNEDILEVYKISYFWIMPIAWSVTVVVGSVSSLFIGSNKHFNPKMISPVARWVIRRLCSKKFEEFCAKHEIENVHEKELQSVNQDSAVTPMLNGEIQEVKNGIYLKLNSTINENQV